MYVVNNQFTWSPPSPFSQPVKKVEEKQTETTVAPSDKDSGAADAEGEG